MGDAREAMGTKRCPRCGQQLFGDMEVCYGCLYDFSRDGAGRGDTQGTGSLGLDGVTLAHQPWDAGLPPTEVHPEDDALPTTADVAVAPREPSQLFVRVNSPSMEVTLPLPDDGLLVGRGNVCDVILHSRSVSRHHVRIVPRDGAAIVEDCGSTNRATLRGREVGASARMEVGDTLNVCGTIFFLQGSRSG